MIDNICCKTLNSGIKCYIIPKKDYVEKQAMIAVNYGSIDNKFIVDDEEFDFPEGIAHFLEHKLFEEEKINVFDEFSKLGASVNAFTNFNSTAYYFNCTENFNQSLKLLLQFVSNPYFTDESVEKEKGIIKQEIKMYEDDYSWQVYFNMLDAMYFEHPVKFNIAGTVESINKIKKEDLYKCYETFYTFNNAVIVCCGDFNKEEIYNIVEENLKLNNNKKVQRIYGKETDDVKNKYIQRKMLVDKYIFNIGFKENRFCVNILDRICQNKILLDIIAGESSDLFELLYSENLIDNSFSYDYLSGINFGAEIISGVSNNPLKIKKLLMDKINQLKKEGINEEHFQRIKLKHKGRFIRGFNSIDAIASSQVDFFSKGIELEDIYKKYDSISLDDINQCLKALDEDKSVLSVIEPQ